ncbi:E3 ubiquitin-protein ligase siah-1-like [Zootermopsis nevadensis]|uniref:RING-type E3 ubiquitin transferase n=1 Tax=Zootermopsis nevadensis TaxID=136037 RepID=A0A067QRJ6_ZOONE|nr:E3 ubiquitin-protein ligase siah-1-like [Zootermopsis nevadensis]XP_021934736.1 E3 ubiquitin-protein ligase siah-1-like [Zootermopsis nevadensis]KDR11330.1 E3 ubiquitin-protein ligase SIAH1 [Zootermopsis nevadensis]
MARTEEITLKEIECPVCFEYMSPPIMLCRRGHNLCHTCRKDISKCPICKEKFITKNLALEEIANKIKLLHNTIPQPSNHRSPYDLLDEQRTKIVIAEEVSRIILREVKCKVCQNYSLSPIYFCVNGHSTCNACKKCRTCAGPVTSGRNFALETIARSAEYQCRYRDFGCASILTLLQAQHEDECEYKPVMCPLFDAVGVRCSWSGISQDFKFHVMHEHVSCRVFEGTFISLNIRYSSNTVIFALNKMFLMSILVKNGAVLYRFNLEGPADDIDKYKCVNRLLSGGDVITTFVFSPSPKWKEFYGGIFMDCSSPTIMLNVCIQKT